MTHPGEPTKEDRKQLYTAEKLERFKSSDGYDTLRDVVSQRVGDIFHEIVTAHPDGLAGLQGRLRGLLDVFRVIEDEIDGAEAVRRRLEAEVQAARTRAVREAGNVSPLPRRRTGGAL